MRIAAMTATTGGTDGFNTFTDIFTEDGTGPGPHVVASRGGIANAAAIGDYYVFGFYAKARTEADTAQAERVAADTRLRQALEGFAAQGRAVKRAALMAGDGDLLGPALLGVDRHRLLCPESLDPGRGQRLSL